jgi:hypothetical protein
MSRYEPLNVPPGVMRALHQLEAGAYDPACNDRAGDDYAWADEPAPGRTDQVGRWLANTAFIVAILLAAMMLAGFFAAVASGRAH